MENQRIIHKTGGVTLTGEGGVNFFRLVTILQGMKFELKTGMKLTRGPSCFTHARRTCGIKGNKAKLIAQMEVIVAEARDALPTEVRED
jgi:hypothetical protein